MYDYITSDKLLNALQWLKVHNPLYVDVEINQEWSEEAQNNDIDLYVGLTNATVGTDSSSQMWTKVLACVYLSSH